MNQLSFYALLASVVPVGVSEVSEAPLPNILLIIADDLGTDMLKPYKIGDDLPNTPNLDALASKSVLFRNAWSSPNCSPTRACIQTGRLGARTGIGEIVRDKAIYFGLPSAEMIIPELLDSATQFSYAHAFFGKWHLNHVNDPDPSGAPVGPDVVRIQGYDHYEGAINNFTGTDTYYNWPKVSNGDSSQSNVYATTATVNDFLGWHANVNGPYFAVLAFQAPHTPLHAPPFGLYSQDLSSFGPSNMKPRAFYKAMVEAVDFEVGRLLLELGSSLSNTTVIFMSDNGTPRQIVSADPFHTLATTHSKGFPYEGGVNIPLYISGPSVMSPGTECVALVHAVDIFATVAELAGIDLSDPAIYPPNRTLDSESLVPLLEDPTLPSKRQFNYTERFYNNTQSGAQIDYSQVSKQPIVQAVIESTFSELAPRLSMVGQAMVHQSGNTSTIFLRGAPANAEAFVLVGGFDPAPNPSFGGQVTVSPNNFKFLKVDNGKLDLTIPFVTDASGRLNIPGIIYQQSLPIDYYVQFAIQDPATLAWKISNAIRVNQTTNVKAIVNTEGYKLISYVSGGATELYHLPTDPREKNNLLSGGVFGLSGKARLALESLRSEVLNILKSVKPLRD